MDDALDEPERNGEGGGEKRPNDLDVNVMLCYEDEGRSGTEFEIRKLCLGHSLIFFSKPNSSIDAIEGNVFRCINLLLS